MNRALGAVVFGLVLPVAACDVRVEHKETMSTPEQLHAQGIQAMGAGEYDKAIELFEIVTQHQPQQPVPWANLCKATVAADRDERAAKVCAKARRLNPKDANIHHVLGHLAMAEDERRAAGHFRRAIALDAGDAASYNGLAGALHELGDAAGAIAAARKAAELDPRDPSRPLFVAKLLALNGRCDQARQALAAAAADGGGDIATARSLIEKKCSAE
jgi:Flp pilus assembly protein TadD